MLWRGFFDYPSNHSPHNNNNEVCSTMEFYTQRRQHEDN